MLQITLNSCFLLFVKLVKTRISGLISNHQLISFLYCVCVVLRLVTFGHRTAYRVLDSKYDM